MKQTSDPYRLFVHGYTLDPPAIDAIDACAASSLSEATHSTLACYRPQCTASVEMYAFVATDGTPEDWPIGESVACALGGGTAPRVQQLAEAPVGTPVWPNGTWFRLSFCAERDAVTFFESKNNTQSLNRMCSSGSPGVAGVALFFRGRSSLFSRSSYSGGACSPFRADQLGYTGGGGVQADGQTDPPVLVLVASGAVGGVALFAIVSFAYWKTFPKIHRI